MLVIFIREYIRIYDFYVPLSNILHSEDLRNYSKKLGIYRFLLLGGHSCCIISTIWCSNRLAELTVSFFLSTRRS